MRSLTRPLVAIALIVVAGCSPDERSSPDPIESDRAGSNGADSAGTDSGGTGAGTTPASSTTPVTSPETTSPEERERAHAESAVADALSALGRQPAVTYSSRLSAPAPEPDKTKKTVRLGRVRVVATSSGLVHGGGSVRQAPLEMLTIDAKLYLRMAPAHWKRLGVDDATAAIFSYGWTVTSPQDVGFDPRRGLRPVALAERLAVPEGAELSYRSVRQADGKQVYRVDVEGGTIDVSVRRPHRVTRTTVPIWDELTTGGPSGNLNFGHTALTFISEPTAGEIRDTRESVKAQRPGLRASLVLAPSLRVRVTDVATMSCSQFGECTITARVTNRVRKEFVPVTSVQVLLQGFLDGGPLGAKRCSASMLMVVDAAASVSCSVEFVVPIRGRRYDINGRVLASGFARWDPNPKTIARQIGLLTAETLEALADR